MDFDKWMKDFQEKYGRLLYADEVFEGGKLAEREQSKDISKHFVDRMKLFIIDLDNVNYDSYDSCVIAANSKEEVEEMCRMNDFPIVGGLLLSIYLKTRITL